MKAQLLVALALFLNRFLASEAERRGVRALFAHVLAEDHPPARAFVTDTAALAPLRLSPVLRDA